MDEQAKDQLIFEAKKESEEVKKARQDKCEHRFEFVNSILVVTCVRCGKKESLKEYLDDLDYGN